MGNSYFWKKASGLKADIVRHKEHAIDLENRLSILESKPKESVTRLDMANIRILRNFLYLLYNSMAEVTSRIGRKPLR